MEGFDYDPVGNRYPTSNVYNAANQLLEDDTYIYSYDRNGNTVSKINKVTAEYTRYYWNAENQMTMIEEYSTISSSTPVSVSSYIYDGLGRRVAKNVDSVITKYLYDQEDILLESDDNDNMLARYTHGPGIDEPIIMERNGASYYYVADGLGSIVKLVDTVGTVVNNYVYDSFGNMLEKTEGVTNFYTYTAREYDAESGLYYYRTRYYDARIGRFLSEDPKHYSQIRDDIYYAILPTSCFQISPKFNAYEYALNNPIRFVDPHGEIAVTVVVATIGVVGTSTLIYYIYQCSKWTAKAIEKTKEIRAELESTCYADIGYAPQAEVFLKLKDTEEYKNTWKYCPKAVAKSYTTP
jgi:RHS repeat-associated protein